MANEEHLKVIQQGIIIWNKWKKMHPEVRPDLRGADLSFANLNFADLSYTHLDSADLRGADFTHAGIGWTIFGNVDLQSVKVLATISHLGPSTIGVNTLERSQGNIPEIFLRGAGVSDNVIAYARSLAATPIEYYTCFISFSKKDQVFTERLYNDLQGNGVRCWYAPKELKIGDFYRHKIDESIRIHDKLLLVLSEHSIKSAWVEEEVQRAWNQKD
jgi:hypothetical protein